MWIQSTYFRPSWVHRIDLETGLREGVEVFLLTLNKGLESSPLRDIVFEFREQKERDEVAESLINKIEDGEMDSV